MRVLGMGRGLRAWALCALLLCALLAAVLPPATAQGRGLLVFLFLPVPWRGRRSVVAQGVGCNCQTTSSLTPNWLPSAS